MSVGAAGSSSFSLGGFRISRGHSSNGRSKSDQDRQFCHCPLTMSLAWDHWRGLPVGPVFTMDAAFGHGFTSSLS